MLGGEVRTVSGRTLGSNTGTGFLVTPDTLEIILLLRSRVMAMRTCHRGTMSPLRAQQWREWGSKVSFEGKPRARVIILGPHVR